MIVRRASWTVVLVALSALGCQNLSGGGSGKGPGLLPGGAPAGPGVAPSIDLAGACAAALAATPGQVVSAKLKSKNGLYGFEVDVLGSDGLVHEVKLGGDGKPVSRLPWDQDTPDAKPKTAAAMSVTRIDAASAIGMALGAAPGTAVSVDLSTSKNLATWEVKVRNNFGQETKVKLDAGTGQLVP